MERSLRCDLGIGSMQPDDDGDYGIVHDGMLTWTRIMAGDDPLVRVWARAAYDVKRTAKLLVELNDINSTLRLIRCFWHDGAVIVAGEMVLESVEPGDLGGLVTHVASTARHTGELIAAVFGGALAAMPVCDQDNERDQAGE